MLKVYIADDEEVVRQGLKKIIDWNELGFEVCGEAGNGLTAYEEIKNLNPNLILLDIRMPKLHGLQVASKLRQDGYDGRVIILSGYSEFKFAQDAIRCDVDRYLTKPIDEEELMDAVLDIRSKILRKNKHHRHLSYYQEKAKDRILEDIIKGESTDLNKDQYTLADLDLKAKKYQVLILKSIDEDYDAYALLCEALKVPSNGNMIKRVYIGGKPVVLLKGEKIINRLNSYCARYESTENNSYFIAIGNIIESAEGIFKSYYQAQKVFVNQFFFEQDKHFADESDLPDSESLTHFFTAKDSKSLGQQLYDLIIVFKKSECDTFFSELKSQLIHSRNSGESIKSVLAGMYIFIVQEFKRTYANYNPEFLTNAEIIQWFHSCAYLQELLLFMKTEANRLIQIIGGYSSESIVDEIVEYMKYHYSEDIKLKNIAPRFGYNSSYLGKIFSKKLGAGFNDYLHKIRAEKAKELLLNKKYKIYEISSLVGYKNVDYFHLKFKHFEGCTPNEYRIAHAVEIE